MPTGCAQLVPISDEQTGVVRGNHKKELARLALKIIDFESFQVKITSAINNARFRQQLL